MSYPQNPGQGQNPQQPYGQQPSGPQAFPGQQPYGQPYPGQQPAPYSGPQPMPGQPYSGPQPVPGQYPQQYGQPSQPFPAYPGGPGMLQQKPGGGTAITAAVLAILGGIVALLGVISSIVGLATFHGTEILFIISLVVDLALAGLLLYGAIALIMHKPAGRMCVIIGCGVSIAFSLISVILSAAGATALGSSAEFLGVGIAGALVGLIPPVATLVLAIVKPTQLWVGLGAPAQPQYPGTYPPQQSW